jgi:hypothetical protein
MTEQQVMEWMEEYLDGTKVEATALGMIKADIDEHGFENWLNMPAIPIVEWYLQTTNEVATQLVSDYKMMLDQEKELDELGISQSLKLDPVQSMDAFKNGVVEVFESLLVYLTTQEMANAYYGEHTH